MKCPDCGYDTGVKIHYLNDRLCSPNCVYLDNIAGEYAKCRKYKRTLRKRVWLGVINASRCIRCEDLIEPKDDVVGIKV